MSIIGHNSAPTLTAAVPAAPLATMAMANVTNATVAALNSTVNSTILARDIDAADVMAAYEGPSVLGLFVGLILMYTLYELMVILHCAISGKEVWPKFVQKTCDNGVRGLFRKMWVGIGAACK